MLNKNRIKISMPVKHFLLLDKKNFYSLCRLFLLDDAENNYELFITVEDAETDTDFDRIMNFFSEVEVSKISRNALKITTIFGYVYIIKK